MFPLLLRIIWLGASEEWWRGCTEKKFSAELKDKPLPTDLSTASSIQLPQVQTQCHCPKHTPPCNLSPAFLAHVHAPSCTTVTSPYPHWHYSRTPFFLHTFLPCAQLGCFHVCSVLSAHCLTGENNHRKLRQQSNLQAIPSYLWLFSAKQQLGRGGGCKTGWATWEPLMGCATWEQLWSHSEATKCVV